MRSDDIFLRGVVILFLSSVTVTALAKTRTSDDPDIVRLRNLLEGDDGHPRGPTMNREELKAFMTRLSALPPGDPVRVEAISLARHYGSPAELEADEKDNPRGWRDTGCLNVSWEILQTTGVLREGMPLEDVVAVLGSPYLRNETDDGVYVRWYYSTPMHVNPALIVRFNEKLEAVVIEVTKA